MSALTKSLLLFALNWLDAQLTLVWVHAHVATEGNGLMAPLLGLGDAPFMLAKLAVGFFAAYTLYRCSHLMLARRGMQLVLTGWTDYAYSSDNFAAHQAGLTLDPPVLQVPAGDGWRTVHADVGFPVGRPQAIVVDLAGQAYELAKAHWPTFGERDNKMNTKGLLPKERSTNKR